jgi:diguanylate cyclase (GGDEF)-like protein
MLLTLRKSEAHAFIVMCFCLTAAAHLANAQASSVLSSVRLSPTTGATSIAEAAEVMCDPGGNIPLESARSGAYTALESEYPTSEGCRGYWVRVNLNATGIPPGGWVLELSRGWWLADLYVSEDGSVAIEHTGTDVAPQSRSLVSGDMAFPVPLKAGTDQVVYLHLVGDTTRFGESRAIAATILTSQEWIRQQRGRLFGQGIYAGIVVALALYNLVLFFSFRERAYLYYVIYVCAFGAFWIARAGFFYQYLWPGHPLWDRHTQPFLAAIAIVFSILFVRRFLAIPEHSRKVDRLLLGIAVLTVVLYLASFSGVRFALAPVLAAIGLVVTILYAAIGLAAVKQGYRPARFFLIAFAALLAGNVLYILMFLRVLPMTFLTYNAAQAGSAIECILLAFSLAGRMDVLMREHEEKQVEYTHDLQELVQRRTAELSAAFEQLKTASITDPLTGLSNRRHVDAAIQPWIAELQRARIRNLSGIPRRYLAICLGDLDHFKLVNDSLGHAAGDKVLQAAAEILRQNVRATAILARWGGEEFLILDHVTGQYDDLLMAERLRLSIMQDALPVIVESGSPLSLSLGVVRYPFSESYPDLLDWDHCLALADHALYRAKNSGRNRWRCYRPNEGALRRAIQSRGEEEIRRLLRVHSDEAFTLGLIEIVDQIPANAPVR